MKKRLIYIVLFLSSFIVKEKAEAQAFPYVFTDFNQNYDYSSNIGTHDRLLFNLGQSNSVGSAPDCTLSTMPFTLSYLARYIKDAHIIDENYLIDTLRPGINTSAPRNYDPYYLDNLGMEVNFARLVQNYYKDNFGTYILKYAWGGQSIDMFLPTGAYFQPIKRMADSLFANTNLKRTDPIIIYWDQGEEDASLGDLVKASTYDLYLDTLLSAYTDSLQLTNVTFIMREHIVYTSWTYIRELIAAQRRFAAAHDNVYLIRSDNLILGDKYHINLASQAEMANRIFEIAKKVYR